MLKKFTSANPANLKYAHGLMPQMPSLFLSSQLLTVFYFHPILHNLWTDRVTTLTRVLRVQIKTDHLTARFRRPLQNSSLTLYCQKQPLPPFLLELYSYLLSSTLYLCVWRMSYILSYINLTPHTVHTLTLPILPPN